MTEGISKHIKDAMKLRGTTSRRLHREINANGHVIDYTTIHRVIKGITTDPRISTLARMSDALNIAPEELIGVPNPEGLDSRISAMYRSARVLSNDDKELITTLIRRFVAFRKS